MTHPAMQRMTVCVHGLGYVGLPTAAMIALGGHDVVGYDVNAQVLTALREGAHEIKEGPVRALVQEALRGGRLTLRDAPAAHADAYVICVPTPTVDRKPDLSYLQAALREIAPLLEPGGLVVIESTVPPRTIERVVAPTLRSAGVDLDAVAVAHCPERVSVGSIVRDLRENERVIGGRKPGDAEAARPVYASFCTGAIHLTDAITAELAKVAENTYRDVNIAFANELALLAEELGADVHEVIALANRHPRVAILAPGPGVGGHCIPVDPHFLANANPFVAELIATSRRVNERMPEIVVRHVAELLPASVGARVALLGASFKANVEDTRESPTEHVEELLRARGYETRVFDPIAERYARPLCSSLEEAVRGCDAIVLMVAHDAFAALDPAAIAPLCRTRNVIDTRGFLRAESWYEQGFALASLGGKARVPVRLAASA
jgi:UDP-N-acetyl-D-mannosaminuronic acid dehydrogenase